MLQLCCYHVSDETKWDGGSENTALILIIQFFFYRFSLKSCVNKSGPGWKEKKTHTQLIKKKSTLKSSFSHLSINNYQKPTMRQA